LSVVSLLMRFPFLQRRIFISLLGAVICCLLGLLVFNRPVFAQQPTPTAEPESTGRKASLTIDVSQFEWLLTRWNSQRAACSIAIEHPGLPTLKEVSQACGASIAEDWQDTAACQQNPENGDVSACKGVYLHLVREKKGQRAIEVFLPAPKAWISLVGCEQQPQDNRCSEPPALLISGEEPLPNESIIRVQGVVNGSPFSCPGNQCVIALPPTGVQGVTMEFWAESSFGDSTPHYSALIRILPWGDFMAPEGRRNEQRLWYTDVLSSQWRGPSPASCSDIWKSLPDVSGPSAWLNTPQNTSELKSSISYYFLSGMLIQNGQVDASSCPGGGLAMPQVANTCGVQAALPEVVAWQNRFDTEILRVSKDWGVPAQLLKNIFSRESQLWPGIFQTYKEAGLGQMSDRGADTVLLWNQAFFDQFCPLVLGQDTCNKGFGNLKSDEQNILRGALVRKVNAACTDCPQGIDLTQAQYSVQVFAQTLLANCEQVAQTFQNIFSRSAGEVSSYEDLWRFTLVNYNAGAGCLAEAVNKTRQLGLSLTWLNVSANLEGICADSAAYVDGITRVNGMEPTPTVTPWLVFRTPVVTLTPTPPAVPGQMTPTHATTVIPTQTPSPNSSALSPTANPYP
jgi:hypothetical protein